MSKKIHAPDLIRMREQSEKIVMLTAYDYLFASIVDRAGADVILVGDSLATVIQGNENTLPVTLDEMIYHARLVARGAKRALVVADMPFMSYQLGETEALAAAGRFLKEAGVSAVKLEGGVKVAKEIQRIVDAEIPVMGHVGLTPQSYHRMGGHRLQGRAEQDRKRVYDDALAVEDAGAFAIVLEGIPEKLAKDITERLSIPTIGIGAGVYCSGQVLVTQDMLGLVADSDAGLPKFVKKYAELTQDIERAIRDFSSEVRKGIFPAEEHSYLSERQKVTDLQSVRKASERG